MAVLEDDTLVSHIPRKIFQICSLFLAMGITCTPIGGRRYSSDLPQEGLEIPCELVFTGKSKEIEKVKTLFAHKAIVSNTVPKPMH